MRRWSFTLLLFALVGCRFSVDRELEPGELRGRFVLQQANGTRVPAANTLVTLPGTRVNVRTDGNGRFTIRGLPTARYTLRAAHEVSADGRSGSGLVVPNLTLSEDSGALDLGTVVLDRLAALEGAVTLNGEPVAGARVALNGVGERVTGAAGRYLFEGLYPVLSDGGAGIERFAGPTAGYLLAFPLAALAVGEIVRRPAFRDPAAAVALMIGAHLFILAAGTLWLAASLGAPDAVSRGFAPFLIGAAVKSVAVVACLMALRRLVPGLRP